MNQDNAVKKSAQLIEEKTALPDGPNVGPSPYEHRVAQGEMPASVARPDGGMKQEKPVGGNQDSE
jgi:hypothetical protein